MTEEQVMMKMRASAVEFKNLAREHRYVRAINLYYRVSAVASYIELTDDKRAELFGRQMKVLLSRVCLKKSMLRGYRIKPCRKRLSRTDAEILRRYMILRHICQEVIFRQAD